MNISKHIVRQLLLLAAMTPAASAAQEVWTADRCMAYAVQHNRQVRQRELEMENNQADLLKAWGGFLPGLTGGVNAQYNTGRSIDPETNTYNDVNTFNNYYQLEASLPLFQGGSLINEVRRSRAAALMGKAGLQEQRDNTALETFQAYILVVYQKGMARMARTKLAESDSTLHKTRLMEELGMKGAGDLAQVEAQHAADVYNLTKQTNLLATALLDLKQKMNYPIGEELAVDTTLIDLPAAQQATLPSDRPEEVFLTALRTNPTLQKAQLNAQAAKMQLRISWAALLPRVSAFAGVNTSYYKVLHQEYPPFGTQFKNNRGTYFGVTLSVPLFNRLAGVTGVRRARNNHRIAQEQYEEQKSQLRKLVEQAVLDREGCLKESIQMEEKVEADSLAYTIARRKYEEGLMTTLDMQLCAANWQNSQASLLQSRLTYFMKCRMVDYYKGGDLVRY